MLVNGNESQNAALVEAAAVARVVAGAAQAQPGLDHEAAEAEVVEVMAVSKVFKVLGTTGPGVSRRSRSSPLIRKARDNRKAPSNRRARQAADRIVWLAAERIARAARSADRDGARTARKVRAPACCPTIGLGFRYDAAASAAGLALAAGERH